MATVILPIGLGATAMSSLLVSQHRWIFSVGGVLTIGAGIAMLAGWKPSLPMPGVRTVAQGSYGSAYALGAFSGAASACCAPVLAGVAVLAGATASFPVALAIGGAYVAGMVAPLALIALAWDRRRERAARLLSDPTLSLRLGFWQRRIALGHAASGLLMIAMGVLAVVLAFTGPGMPSGGWQTQLSAWLQHLSATLLHALSWIPGWVLALILVGGFGLLIRRAVRATPAPALPGTGLEAAVTDADPIPAIVEETPRDQHQR